jgi:hypothetical protein
MPALPAAPKATSLKLLRKMVSVIFTMLIASPLIIMGNEILKIFLYEVELFRVFYYFIKKGEQMPAF